MAEAAWRDRNGGGLRIHAVVRRRRADRALEALRLGGDEVNFTMVSEGGLAAAVTPRDAPPSTDPLQLHARVVAALLRRPSLVPLPPGLTARGPEAVCRFLADARVPLEEALDSFENRYEMRLHVRSTPEERLPHNVFQALRSRSSGASRLEPAPGAALSAAFLVPRGEWIGFVEAATRWETRYPGLELDVTGPWAPFDFVEFRPDPDLASDTGDPDPGQASGKADPEPGQASGKAAPEPGQASGKADPDRGVTF